MLAMQCVQHPAVSVDTRDCVQRMSSARVLDHRIPSNGIMYAIGPPTKNSGTIAGHRNTKSGYFRVTHTFSTPFSFKIEISSNSFSLLGVFLGALVR